MFTVVTVWSDSLVRPDVDAYDNLPAAQARAKAMRQQPEALMVVIDRHDVR